LRFAQASQHAAVLSHGSHLKSQPASRTHQQPTTVANALTGAKTKIKMISSNVLVPLRVGAGQVAEDAAESHPQGEDRLANVGTMLSTSCRKQQFATSASHKLPSFVCSYECDQHQPELLTGKVCHHGAGRSLRFKEKRNSSCLYNSERFAYIRAAGQIEPSDDGVTCTVLLAKSRNQKPTM
jgi:hypothetical protein